MEPKKTIIINLLRPDRVQIVRRIIVISGLFLIVLASGFMFSQYKLAVNSYAIAKENKAVLTARLEKEHRMQEVVRDNEKLEALIKEKRQVISELSKRQASFANLLKTINAKVPPTVFIENIEISEKNLFLSGSAVEPGDFIHFLNLLDKSLLIEDIVDFSSTMGKNAGIFTIDIEWKAEKR